jgi:hypothetical protein
MNGSSVFPEKRIPFTWKGSDWSVARSLTGMQEFAIFRVTIPPEWHPHLRNRNGSSKDERRTQPGQSSASKGAPERAVSNDPDLHLAISQR